MDEVLITPFRFAIVENGLYRGAYPNPKSFPFLKRLKLRTVVSLTPKSVTPELEQFCATGGIALKWFRVAKMKEECTMNAELVTQLLELLITIDQQPLYVHCLDGSMVTGTLIMALRKLQMWSLSSTFTEFGRFTRETAPPQFAAEFVESFRGRPVVSVPAAIPHWLWGGQAIKKHNTIRVQLLSNADASGSSTQKGKRQNPAALSAVAAGGGTLSYTNASNPSQNNGGAPVSASMVAIAPSQNSHQSTNASGSDPDEGVLGRLTRIHNSRTLQALDLNM